MCSAQFKIGFNRRCRDTRWWLREPFERRRIGTSASRETRVTAIRRGWMFNSRVGLPLLEIDRRRKQELDGPLAEIGSTQYSTEVVHATWLDRFGAPGVTRCVVATGLGSLVQVESFRVAFLSQRKAHLRRRKCPAFLKERPKASLKDTIDHPENLLAWTTCRAERSGRRAFRRHRLDHHDNHLSR